MNSAEDESGGGGWGGGGGGGLGVVGKGVACLA